MHVLINRNIYIQLPDPLFKKQTGRINLERIIKKKGWVIDFRFGIFRKLILICCDLAVNTKNFPADQVDNIFQPGSDLLRIEEQNQMLWEKLLTLNKPKLTIYPVNSHNHFLYMQNYLILKYMFTWCQVFPPDIEYWSN